jgi:hypothetical protein
MAALTLKQQPPAEAMPANSQFVAPANAASSRPRADQRDANAAGARQQPGPAVATHN